MSNEQDHKRTIFINGFESNKQFKYPSNYISTTKYNIVTFFPRCLFEQFKKLANIYFLAIAVLQSIPQISPLTPFTAIFPLVFVLAVAMIREGVEDYFRYKSDKEVNSVPVNVYRNGSFSFKRCDEIHVGEIALLRKDDAIPCDMVMLSNSNENGVAYIETSTIDGEKTLKPRQAFPETLKFFRENDFIRIFSMVQCDLPNPRIYQFNGAIDYKNKKYPLDKNNLLLGGAFIRNTAWVIGVVVYTGKETKLRQNLMARTYKQSSIEKNVNKYIFYILIMQFVLCTFCAILSGIWSYKYLGEHYYIDQHDFQSGLVGFLSYFTYLLLLNTMLPISLIISLELIKVAQGFFMERDIEMYSKIRNRTCKVSSYSLNEELGMVQHIFSDKTGTLTQNKMEFKFCSVGNKMYGDKKALSDKEFQSTATYSTKETIFTFNSKEITNDLFSEKGNEKLIYSINYSFDEKMQSFSKQSEPLDHFFRCMSLCHECLVESNNNGDVDYIGQSPDEIALVDAARHLGYRYWKIKNNEIELHVIPFRNEDKKIREFYEKICVLEFDSDRKRNSVVVREKSTNKIFLYIKGADNIIKQRLDPRNSSDYLEKISHDLDTYSKRGYRTLLFGFKIIEEEEFLSWMVKFAKASTAIEDRYTQLSQCAEEIEKGIFLLGCTAVEDSLQDEVPNTINSLLNAGIKVWMLTGDKLETAENIGKTCSLLSDEMIIEKCSETTISGCLITLSQIDRVISSSHHIDSALIIEGQSLEIVLFDIKNTEKVQKYPEFAKNEKKIKEITEHFLNIASRCKTVICCRVTPGQKREVVKLMKDRKKLVTLSIGDGANDVSMILEAQVGVGIYGEEGMQAVQASDYAIGEFKYLWELLLVHGRFNYIRQSEMILYFFYKNLVFTIPQFLFSFYCAYSGKSIWDDWYITLFNMLFTAVPLMIRALFEKDIIIPRRAETSSQGEDRQSVLRRLVPRAYNIGRTNKIFTRINFFKWVINGFFHSLIIFFIPLYALSEGIMNKKGDNYDFWTFSITAFTCVLFIVNLKLFLHTKLWNSFHSAAMLGTSIFIYFVFMLIYDALSSFSNRFSVWQILLSSYFYFSVLISMSIVVVIDGGLLMFRRISNPDDSEVLMDYSLSVKREKMDKIKINKSRLTTPFITLSSSQSQINWSVLYLNKIIF
ncbi:unnamed protein product [Blepharisma stoltei]|uniref:Phospholipid-transporting ATPase n=1 Tax=Blepharisma stoltei TaxID=1481888 RepID=A0AAU9JJA1_9CILI|nr:unnamed protein product [Blepharisma stoltei]